MSVCLSVPPAVESHLGDREDVDPAFLLLLPAHEHGGAHQEKVRHPVFVHVQGAQHAAEVGANLGEKQTTLHAHTLGASAGGETPTPGPQYLFPSLRVDDRELLLGTDGVDDDLPRVVGPGRTCHKVFCGPVAHCGDRVAWDGADTQNQPLGETAADPFLPILGNIEERFLCA